MSATHTEKIAELQIRLFGIPSVSATGAPSASSMRPLCAVLLAMAVLSEPDRRLSRKSLAAELWPDDDEAAAAANLRRHLSFLISSFPALDAVIGRDRDALWSTAAATPWCDVREFERGAIELYRGDFMAGISHEWVEAHRERLRSVAVDGLVRRIETLREDDDYEAAVALARRATEIAPGDEAVANLEIELHGERGDITAMDAARASLERRLHDIDAKPSHETLALVERFHRLARDAAARIPRPMTSYVGGEARDAVAHLVAGHRLVTIVGPGGVGKTRLALEVAHRIAATFADGAYFADLSTVTHADGLPAALARSLGAPTDLSSKGSSGVRTFLGNRRALLVMDNCEQITHACAMFASELLEAAPNVHVIATSREALGLRIERCYSLLPLSLAEAAELFLGRALGAAWNGGSRDESAARIASVCKRLDGLPLAIELAASMLGTLSLNDVERQLGEALQPLYSRDPTRPARHQSLQDVIAWGVGLLDEAERDAFVRLSVFAGSFSAAAAKAICNVELGTIGGLVAKSVLVREDALESRFVFLISIGEYASRLFDADPRAADIRDAHAAWYAALAMRSEELGFWNEERTWLREIERDFANAAAALRWTLLAGGTAEHGLRLAIGITQYFIRRAFFNDGVRWLHAAVARAAIGTAEHARNLICLANLEKSLGNFETAFGHARAAREEFEGLAGDRDRELARALNCEAGMLLYMSRFVEAKACLDRALPLAERSGDRRTEGQILGNIAYIFSLDDDIAAREWFVLALRRFTAVGDAGLAARTLNAIAGTDFNNGRYDAAIRNLERAREMFEELEDLTLLSDALSDLGGISVMRGDLASARAYYAKAFALCEGHGLELTRGFVLSGIGAIGAMDGALADAARLLGASHLGEHGANTPANNRVFDHARALATEALGADACDLEMLVGRGMSRKDTARLVRAILA